MPYAYREVDDGGSMDRRLKILMGLAVDALEHPDVRETAIAVVTSYGCQAKDDECEAQAVFDAVKHGNPNVPGLESGVRYQADPVGPRVADHFTAPWALLEQCRRGICAEDCDSQAALVVGLMRSLGFQANLRAYFPKKANGKVDRVNGHVYPVVGMPKDRPDRWLGMDTTVARSFLGWEPDNGVYTDAYPEGEQ